MKDNREERTKIRFEYRSKVIHVEKRKSLFIDVWDGDDYVGALSGSDIVDFANGEVSKDSLERIEGLVRNVNTDEEVQTMKELLQRRIEEKG